jgi:hypothetical protein
VTAGAPELSSGVRAGAPKEGASDGGFPGTANRRRGGGTGILVLFGAGSVVAALRVGGGELDYPGLGIVAITFASRSPLRSTRSGPRLARTLIRR